MVPVAASLVLAGCATVGRDWRERGIRFAGEEWTIRGDAGTPRGPGPNFFGVKSDSVRVDKEGRLHLRLKRRGKRWVCAEVASVRSYGRGTFRWTLSPGHRLLPHGAVLGLFTWAGEAVPHHREADIEFLDEGTPEILFSVQPAEKEGRSQRFPGALSPGRSTHSMSLRPDRVDFESASDKGGVLSWTAEAPVEEGSANAMMNLWLRPGARVQEDARVEVVVESFEFVPE